MIKWMVKNSSKCFSKCFWKCLFYIKTNWGQEKKTVLFLLKQFNLYKKTVVRKTLQHAKHHAMSWVPCSKKVKRKV